MSRDAIISKREWLIFSIIVSYLLLIIFYNFYVGAEKVCRFQNNCIQFCCEDQEIFDESNIKYFLSENYDSFHANCNGIFDYKQNGNCSDDSVYRGLLSSHGVN